MTETLHLKKNDTLKATTYEMVNTEVIPIVNHQQIILENYETFGDTIPPAHLIAMNGIFN